MWQQLQSLRYDTRCYFNVRSKADISQLNLTHGKFNSLMPRNYKPTEAVNRTIQDFSDLEPNKGVINNCINKLVWTSISWFPWVWFLTERTSGVKQYRLFTRQMTSHHPMAINNLKAMKELQSTDSKQQSAYWCLTFTHRIAKLCPLLSIWVYLITITIFI